MTNWSTQYSNKVDQYPKTLASAVAIMATHELSAKARSKTRNESKKDPKKSDKDKKPKSTKSEASLAQTPAKPVVCYCCGSKEHKADKCPKKNSTPSGEWFVNRAISMAQTSNDTDNVSTVSNDRSFATQPPSTRGRQTEYEGLTHVVSLSQG